MRSPASRARGAREVRIALEPAPHQVVRGLAGVTVSTAGGHELSLERGPGGLRARERIPGRPERRWTVLGASRGEGGILGEGIRQALLRDATYGPALTAALLADPPQGGLDAPHRRRGLAGRQRVPADRRTTRSCRTARSARSSRRAAAIEWMCLPRFDGASIFGAILDRDAGALHARRPPRRACRRTPLPAGHDGAGDDVGHAHGMGDRARRPADRPLAPPRRPLEHAPPVADRHGRRARAAAHAALRQRARRDAHGVRAAARLRAGPRALGRTTAPATARRSPRRPRRTRGRRCGSSPTCGSASRAAARQARTTLREGQTAFVALSWTEHPAPATYDEAHRRLVFTADYWHEWLSHGDFPDHPGAATCSAAR